MLLIETFFDKFEKLKMIMNVNIVLYVWLSLGGDVSPSNGTIRELLPELIRQFCPRSNVCPEHTGISAASKTAGLTSCCTGCSCAAECTQRNDCCFPKLTVQNDVIENSMMTRTRCLSATAIETFGIITPKSYSMITDVPGNQGTACGDVSVAVWGSIYPVYSNKTKLIYKNTACAEAYGVTDGVAWNSYVSCELFSNVNGIYALSTHVMSGFNNHTMSRDCYVYFEYPGEKKDLAPHRCYKDVIDRCPDTEFRLPDSNALNISKQMIREACHSGLFSPFIIAEIYANVFCSICNGNFWQNIDCRETNDNNNRFNNDGFVGLINPPGITTTLNKMSETPIVCPDSGDVDVACRPLQCPAGQFRAKNGDCDQLFGSWYVKPIGVHLTLTSNVKFNITRLLPSSRALQEFSSFSHPWSSPWKLLLLSYESLATNYTSQISVILQNDEPSSNPDRIIRNIMRNMKQPWFLHIGSSKTVTVTLQSNFSKFLSIYRKQMDVAMLDSAMKLTTRFYDILKNNHVAHAPKFIINKLYICDQVELEPSEFVLQNENSILYNKTARRYYFDGEFALKNTKNDTLRANICLEGSGFVQVTDRGCRAPKTITVIACCVLWSLMHGVLQL